MKVLIADDEKDIRRLISFALNRVGYQTFEASDGQMALDMALEIVPDIILLDIMMPKMDGFEVCRRMRAEEVLKDKPILLLSARSQDRDVGVGLKAGATDYIVKPFVPRELVAAVGKFAPLEN